MEDKAQRKGRGKASLGSGQTTLVAGPYRSFRSRRTRQTGSTIAKPESLDPNKLQEPNGC